VSILAPSNRQEKSLEQSRQSVQQAILSAQQARRAVQQAEASLNPQEIQFAQQKLDKAMQQIQEARQYAAPSVSAQQQMDLQQAEQMLMNFQRQVNGSESYPGLQ
jgi:predicted metal-dependent hydrolase